MLIHDVRLGALRFRRAAGDRFHLELDLARMLITLIGLLLQRTQHDFIEPHVDLDLLRRRCERPIGRSPVSIS